MDFNEYRKLSVRTLPSLGSEKLDLSHMIMGVVSELNELEDAILKNDYVEIQEEGIDILWYLSGYAHIRKNNTFIVGSLNFKEDEFKPINDFLFYYRSFFKLKPEKALSVLYKQVSLFTDIVKKHVAYGKEIDELDELLLIGNIQYCISEIFKFYKLDVNIGMRNNIEKLKVRYPEKFNEINALSRNLGAERVELEKI